MKPNKTLSKALLELEQTIWVQIGNFEALHGLKVTGIIPDHDFRLSECLDAAGELSAEVYDWDD